jgi:hypothetical protein
MMSRFAENFSDELAVGSHSLSDAGSSEFSSSEFSSDSDSDSISFPGETSTVVTVVSISRPHDRETVQFTNGPTAHNVRTRKSHSTLSRRRQRLVDDQQKTAAQKATCFKLTGVLFIMFCIFMLTFALRGFSLADVTLRGSR